MSANELRILLPGDVDAQQAVRALDKLMTAMSELEKSAGVRRPGGRTRYHFSRAQTGSLDVALTPVMSADAWTFDRLVEGVRAAADQVTVPAGWNTAAARLVVEVSRMFRPESAPRLELETSRGRLAAVVSPAVGENLTNALTERRVSIGSVIGTLDSATVHDRTAASLWTEGTRRRVPVRFRPDQLDLIRAAFARRVMISGRIERNGFGDPVRIHVKSLEILKTSDEVAPLTDLIGLDPDFTGGMSPVAYIKERRGAA